MLDRHECRRLLAELCIGLYAADFPVLVALEIHKVLCLSHGLHQAEVAADDKWALVREGHLKDSVSWEIAKKVKHYLD